MRTRLIIFLFLLCALDLRAATEITANVTITNVPAGLTTNITVNIGTADTRNWTNSVSGAPSTSIQITNTSAASVTNLIGHFTTYPVFSAGAGTPQALFEFSTNAAAVTNFTITAPLNTNITVTFGGNWATVIYTTNTFGDANPILAPTNAMSARLRTNAENAIINLLGQNKSSNALPFAIRSLSNYLDVASAQTATNKAFITSTNRGEVIIAARSIEASNVTLTTGTISAVNLVGVTNSGFILNLTNGIIYSNGIYFGRLSNPVMTNGVNYGNAFRSDGSGGASLQVGSNAAASALRALAVGVSSIASNQDAAAFGTSALGGGTQSTAVGNNARATTNNTTALGKDSTASAESATAIGTGTTASYQGAIALGALAHALGYYSFAVGDDDTTATGSNSIAIGPGAVTPGNRAIAFGKQASASYDGSVALGPVDYNGVIVSPTTTNQIRMGTSANTISIPNALEAGTVRSLHAIGTNLIDGVFAFTNSLTVASVAPGHNVIDSKTNTILYLTGAPGAAWVLGGFTGDKSDGRELEVWNQTGFDVTIQNESGTAPTASDRILTYATSGGTNATLTGNGLMKFRYSTTASRWLLAVPVVDVLASGTNGVNGISTNGATVTAAATGLNFIGNNNASVDQTTNAAGSVSIQFAPVLFRATNYGTIYNPGDWELLLNEEWIANPVSVAGAIGNHPWTTATAGTLPSLANPIVESNAWSYISLVTTQTSSGRVLACPSVGAAVPTGFVATNCEYFMEARLRFNTTNLTTDVSATRVGFGDGAATTGEFGTGIYIMNNTNVNTNTFILVTARGASKTFNYSTIATYGNQTWVTVGWYLDKTGTNVVAFSGPDRFRFTSFATNNANCPGDLAIMGCLLQNDRMASTGGLNFRTNYCDYIKLWVRRFL